MDSYPPVLPFKSEHSCKMCLHLPKPVNRAPWWEGDICVAWFPSRSPQDRQFPSGGRRVWDSQRGLCCVEQFMWRMHHGSIGQHQSMSRPSFASSQHCYFWPVKGFQGLGWTCLPCAALPCSQAICAGSWLAAGRDKRQKAGAGWLKCSTNRSTIYHHEPAKQRESQAYLISYLLS